jgi:predicted nucleic acid-binding Zn ribbon protein
MKPERIGDDVQRELARFGPAEGMSEIVRAWPAAVGEQIARNAWPARLARDRTLHVATSSSAWAFELAQLEPKLLERLREALAQTTPAALRFAPGKLPGRSSEEIESRPGRGREATSEERELAAALAAGIEDENLREVVAKAALASLARAD